MNAEVEIIRQELLSAIEKDELVLPTLPEVALQVREVAQDQNSNVASLAAVIGRDAAISARIIKVANSPLMRRSEHKNENLKMALMSLGMEYTANLATGLAMEQMFQATTDAIDKRLRETWGRSTEVAGICQVFSHGRGNLRSDQATLAGLTHKLGVLPILIYAESSRALLANPKALDELIDSLHPEVGQKILQRWDFSEQLSCVPVEHLNFGRQIAECDYADVVTVAVLESYSGSEHPLGAVDYATVTAFGRLGIAVDSETIELEDLQDEMQAATTSLMHS